MCGIVGYAGYRDSQPILLESLKRLEYRGYDSCGVAISVNSALETAPTIEVHKDVGRVVDMEKNLPCVHGRVGMGHTRWATHGEVSPANAHPHLDCSGRIAVVHNGVIENFQSLRDALSREGHHFSSETDTEVIAHLIENYYSGDLERAVARALAELVGTYAVIVMAAGHEELVVARRESPLIIGVGDKENFVASDVAAVLDYTGSVVYLEDGDIAVVSGESITITNNGDRVQRERQVIPWSVEEAQKGGYEHFMLKEIHEQPKAIENTLKGHISLIEPL
ncbi:glutamine--fructose-6-phosphate aminotransferase, partial [Dehalococcoidia bacterium]|nr:glutamine--fructose-6-phosphate aminotransferase [Dehalococcoidia bacterium]